MYKNDVVEVRCCLSLYNLSVWPAFADLDAVIKKADLTQQIFDNNQNFGFLGRCRSGRLGGRGLGLLGEKVLHRRAPEEKDDDWMGLVDGVDGVVAVLALDLIEDEGPGAGVGVDREAADVEALDGVFFVVAVATMC